eukprot:6682-Chlamydomonas_euryale.AAC.2
MFPSGVTSLTSHTWDGERRRRGEGWRDSNGVGGGREEEQQQQRHRKGGGEGGLGIATGATLRPRDRRGGIRHCAGRRRERDGRCEGWQG